MKASGEVFGIVSKFGGREELSFDPKMLQVMYSDDRIGKTLSIGSEEDGIMLSVPYEAVQKIIKKEAENANNEM